MHIAHKGGVDTDWFKARKKALKVSDEKLAAAIMRDRTTVTKIINGDVRFDLAFVNGFAEVLQTSRSEILARVGVDVASVQPDQPPVRSADAGDTVEILQLDLSLSMGPGTAIEDFVESEMVAFDAAALRRITRTPSDRLRFVTGIGTSHEPKFQSADQFLININENQLTRLDGYYWITFDGAHALKRLRPLGNGMIQIVSENPDFGPMDVERGAVRIEGRAIWFARGL